MNLLSSFSNFDTFVLASFFILLLLHFVFVRITKILIDILAVYVSFALVVFGPYLLPEIDSWISFHPLARALLFVFFVLFFHVVLWRSNVGSLSAAVRPSDVVVSMVYRVGVVGLFFSTALFFAPIEIKNQLGSFVQLVFANPGALIFWFLLPFLGAFIYHFHAKNGWIE